MTKQAKLLILTASIAVAILIIIIIGAAVRSANTPDEQNGDNNSPTPSYTDSSTSFPTSSSTPTTNPTNEVLTPDLSLSDKQQIQGVATIFANVVGNFGLDPSVLSSPSNLQAVKEKGDTSAFVGLYTNSPSDIASRLSGVTSPAMDSDNINLSMYATAFSVTSENIATNAIIVPNEADISTGIKTVTVEIPMTSSLQFIGQKPNYRDNDGNLVHGDITLESRELQGSLTLIIAYVDNGWKIIQYSDTVGILAIDVPTHLENGELHSSGTVVSKDSKPIS